MEKAGSAPRDAGRLQVSAGEPALQSLKSIGYLAV